MKTEIHSLSTRDLKTNILRALTSKTIIINEFKSTKSNLHKSKIVELVLKK
jgi:hypothetical protein